MKINRGHVSAVVVLGLIAWAATASNSPPQKATAPTVAATSAAPPTPITSTSETRNPHHNVRVSIKWRLGGFDNVALATFTISNDNSFTVKDLRIECEFRGPSGTVIHTASKTLYEKVASKKSLRTKEISFSFLNQQARTAHCFLIGAEQA